MPTCKACNRSFRKGRRRAVLSEDGTVTVTIVCGDCAKRSFSIVRPIGDAAQHCRICKERPARICSDCAQKARSEVVAPILDQLNALARVASLQGQEEQAKAWEGAVRALELAAERQG